MRRLFKYFKLKEEIKDLKEQLKKAERLLKEIEPYGGPCVSVDIAQYFENKDK